MARIQFLRSISHVSSVFSILFITSWLQTLFLLTIFISATKKLFSFFLFVAFALSSVAQTSMTKDARMQWWRDARFGMFIHWGIYAVPAGEYKGDKNHAEWIMNTANIPIPEYEKYAAYEEE